MAEHLDDAAAERTVGELRIAKVLDVQRIAARLSGRMSGGERTLLQLVESVASPRSGGVSFELATEESNRSRRCLQSGFWRLSGRYSLGYSLRYSLRYSLSRSPKSIAQNGVIRSRPDCPPYETAREIRTSVSGR